MAKRDENAGENIDLNRRNTEEPNIPERKKKYDDEAKGIAEVNVKNAHASGDGSMGKDDERLEEGAAGDPEIVNCKLHFVELFL